MDKLSIKFDSGNELDIESINENYNVILKKRNLSLRFPLKSDNSMEVEDMIKAENMKHFIVLADTERIDEFTGYTDIITVDKMINKSDQYISVNSAKSDKSEG